MNRLEDDFGLALEREISQAPIDASRSMQLSGYINHCDQGPVGPSLPSTPHHCCTTVFIRMGEQLLKLSRTSDHVKSTSM